MGAAGPSTILFHEPDADVAQLVSNVLHKRGYSIVAVDTVSRLRRELFGARSAGLAVIHLDRRGRALALARRACLRRPALRLLYIAGRAADGAGLTAEERTFLLRKPFTLHMLCTAIEAEDAMRRGRPPP